MTDELSLPKLAWNSATQSFSNDRCPRKRARLSSPLTSDPVLFSSDDDPSSENYTQSRRKQKFRGPWYSQRPVSEQDSQEFLENPKRSKRTFERQFDSGIWLGSDGSDLDETVEGLQAIDAWNLPVRQSRTTQSKEKTPSPEMVAQGHIELCLEDGNESIDLSSLGLSFLSNATIRPLAAFSRVPPVIEGVFSRLEPRLKIFLGSNDLTTLPAELFNLDNLSVLSLRANRVYELPPGIGKLRKLKELNLSQNGLQYLPFEILNLFSEDYRLQSFTIHPNPFCKPRYLEQEIAPPVVEVSHKIGLRNRTPPRPRRGAICRIGSCSPDARRRSWHPQWKVSYQARTVVRFLDINGSHLKGPTISSQTRFGPAKFPDGVPVAEVGDEPKPPMSRGTQPSRVPSLLEVALNACARTPQLSYLHKMLPEPHPEYFPQLFKMVAEKKEAGGTRCTICKRNFIIPRTEWIEWWEITKCADKKGMASAASPLRQMENERDVVERMVPLMRRGCSWLCVPDTATVQDDEEIAVDT